MLNGHGLVTIDKNNKLTKTQTDLYQQYCLYAAYADSSRGCISVAMLNMNVIEKAQTGIDGYDPYMSFAARDNPLHFVYSLKEHETLSISGCTKHLACATLVFTTIY